MIITISQSLPNQYHIDIFATGTRGGFNDNMDYRTAFSRSLATIKKNGLRL